MKTIEEIIVDLKDQQKRRNELIRFAGLEELNTWWLNEEVHKIQEAIDKLEGLGE